MRRRGSLILMEPTLTENLATASVVPACNRAPGAVWTAGLIIPPGPTHRLWPGDFERFWADVVCHCHTPMHPGLLFPALCVVLVLLVVVDCRGDDAWEGLPVHIPGALRMSITDLHHSSHILPDDELIVLCGVAPDGSDVRRALRLLRLRGRDAVCLQGGIRAWVQAGLPTEEHGLRELHRSGAPGG